MRQYQMIRKIVLEVMKSGNSYTAEDLEKVCKDNGILLEKGRSPIYNVMYQLKRKGEVISDGLGGYLLANCEKKDEKIEEHVTKKEENIMQQNHQINLNGFSLLEPENSREQEKKIQVTEKGEIKLNSSLRNAIKTQDIEIYVSNNGNELLLNVNGKNNCHFTKSGMTRNRKMASIISKNGTTFPVTYVVEWSEKYKMWRGVRMKHISSL